MYQEGLDGEVYEFLTNEPDLPPGIMAELYGGAGRLRRPLTRSRPSSGKKKAWGSSLVAKECQALLIAITHNLLLCYQQDLEARHDVRNMAEDQRRGKRIEAAEGLAPAGWPIPPLLLAARRAAQRSVKFIRWLRHAIREQLAEAAAVARLRVFL